MAAVEPRFSFRNSWASVPAAMPQVGTRRVIAATAPAKRRRRIGTSMSEFVIQNRMPGGKIIAVSDCDSDNLGWVVTFRMKPQPSMPPRVCRS